MLDISRLEVGARTRTLVRILVRTMLEGDLKSPMELHPHFTRYSVNSCVSILFNITICYVRLCQLTLTTPGALW